MVNAIKPVLLDEFNKIMKIYVVRNSEGKYFRAIGYGGYGSNWVDELSRAKFYTKIGQAKSRVTYFFGDDPSFGCPEILEFELDITRAKVLDMREDTEKKIKKKKEKKLKQQEEWNKREREYLEKQQREIEDKLKKL